MSLNGLSEPSIIEAYEKASSEPRGWFLLKYASRDEVELLGKGRCGTLEMRNAIASYEEPSPLFGFLRYRRKNVLVKYVPAGCSRLIQARVTVHFSAVIDQFSPHDATIDIDSPSELRDTTLSAACSLHAATSSTSSSNSSLRRRHLMEITEEDDDGIPSKRQTMASEVVDGEFKKGHAASISNSSMTSFIKDSIVSIEQQPCSMEMETPSLSRKSSDGRPPTSNYCHQNNPQIYLESGLLTQSMIYGRSKIRLGPRPYQDGGVRPHTSISSIDRPVSTLPAGIVSFAKKGQCERELHSDLKYDLDTRTLLVRSSSLISDSPLVRHDTLNRPFPSERPNTSSGFSCRSLPSSAFSVNAKTSATDLAKARLRKAQELRKQKILVAKPLEHNINLSDNAGLTEITPPASPVAIANHELAEAILHDHKRPPDDILLSLENNSQVKNDDSDSTFPESIESTASSTGASSITMSTKASIQVTYPNDGNSSEKAIPFSNDGIISETLTSSPNDVITSGKAISSNDNIISENPISSPNDDISEKFTLSQQFLSQSQIDCQSHSKLDLNSSRPNIDPCMILPIVDEISNICKVGSQVSSKEISPISNTTQNVDPRETIPFLVSDTSSLSSLISQKLSIETSMTLSAARIHASNQSLENSKNHPTPDELEIQKTSSPNLNVRNLTSPITTTNLSINIPVTFIKTENAPNSHQNDLGLMDNPMKKTLILDDGKTVIAEDNLKEQAEHKIDKETHAQNINHLDAKFSSCEEMTDELESAVNQNAEPVTIPKSPIGPSSTVNSRSPVTPSTPVLNHDKDERLPKTRSLNSNPPPQDQSTSPRSVYLSRTESQRSVSTPESTLSEKSSSNPPKVKKFSVGSSISQRIRALERLSTNTSDVNSNAVPVTAPPTFFAVRKSLRTHKSPAKIETSHSVITTESNSSRNSEELPLSSSFNSRSATEESQGLGTTERSQNTSESMFPMAPATGDHVQHSKKCEIIQEISESIAFGRRTSPPNRDNNQRIENNNISFDRGRLQPGKQSTNVNTVVSKERSSSLIALRDINGERRAKTSGNRLSMPLENLHNADIYSKSINSGDNWKVGVPITNRRSYYEREINSNISLPIPSHSGNYFSNDKTENKTSQNLRRMSSMLTSISPGSKSTGPVISSSVQVVNEDRTSQNQELPRLSEPGEIPTTIGEANVQFPDSLLWKRKTILLDSLGNLIIVPLISLHPHEGLKDYLCIGGLRKFHMSEFKMPCAPDLEVEELPNSVILDFFNGGCLQVSCHDRPTQKHILGVLQDAYQKWAK